VADLVTDNDELVVRLTRAERVESVHGDVRVPRSAVQHAEVLADPVREVGGWKLVGSRVPGVFAMGTFEADGRRIFAVVHRHATEGVRVALTGARYDEIVIGCDDAAGVVARISAAT
jgi:hypothetical protein